MEEVEQTSIEDVVRLLHEDSEMFRDQFLEFHTYDQKEMFKTLSFEQRKQLYACLTPEEMSVIFEQVEHDTENVESYLLEMDRRYAAQMLTNMSIDDAVDVLKKLSPDMARTYLRLMPKETASEITDLFQYPDQSAGSLMTTAYVSISATETVSEALDTLKTQAKDAEIIHYAYVVDIYDHLLGIVSLRDLLANDSDTLIPDIMSDRIVSVQALDTQEDIVSLIRDYDLIAVPVVSQDDELLGIVTVDDMIDVMNETAMSGYSNLVGIDVDSKQETIFKSLSARLVGFLGLLGLALVSTLIMMTYQHLIQNNSVLVLFLLFVTATAGSLGTQSLAVTIRKISGKDGNKKLAIIGNELLVAFIIGTINAVLSSCVVGFLTQNSELALVVGLAVVVATLAASLVGSLIPMIAEKLKKDPASISGPFVRTLSDMISVVVYFLIASLFLG